MKWNLWHTLVPAVVWLALAGCGDAPAPERPDPNAHIPRYESFDELAPLFELANDTVYVVNFWATWCKPCVAELPWFERLTADFADRPVRVVLVSLDFPDQIESKLIPFVRERQLRSEVVVLLDERFNAWIPRVDESWGGAIPVTHVHRGTRKLFHARAFRSYDELRQLVEELLGAGG